MKKSIKLSFLLALSLQAQEAIVLDDITITAATNSKQELSQVSADVSVITSEEIEEKHFMTLTDALNSLPGISFTSNGGMGTTQNVFLRGMDSKRVLVIIDGVRYNDITSLSGANFANLMMSDIAQIEVVKGAQSGIWGADATAGVINITTKGAKAGLHGFVSGEAGSFNTKRYGAGASYKTKQGYIKVDSQRVRTDGFSARATFGSDLNSFEDDGYTNMTTNLKAGLNINATNSVDIAHTIIHSTSQYDSTGPNDANAFINADTKLSSVKLHHIDSFNEVDFYANRSVFDRDAKGTLYKGAVDEYGLKSKVGYRESDFLIVGGDYKTFDTKEAGNLKDKSYKNKALFITNSNDFGETLISESLRYDDYSSFENKTTAKIGLKHDFSKQTYLSANIGTAYNVPTAYQLYGPYGSTSINPESTRSYDIALNMYAVKVNYFYSSIDNMIDFDLTTYKYNNLTGTSKIKGYELEYTPELSDTLFLHVGYTKLYAYNNQGQYLKRRPKESLKSTLDYYPSTKLHVGISAEYVGERYDKDNEQGAQTGRYTLFNSVANYDINKNYQLYAKVDNLFDKYYQVIDGYATSPRAFYIGFKANF